MPDNVIPFPRACPPAVTIGRWTFETVKLSELGPLIVQIAETVYADARSDHEPELDRQFALLVLAACSNALYTTL